MCVTSLVGREDLAFRAFLVGSSTRLQGFGTIRVPLKGHYEGYKGSFRGVYKVLEWAEGSGFRRI